MSTLTTMAASEPAATSSFTTVMDYAAQAFESLGALILTTGLLWSVVLAVLAWRRSGSLPPAYAALRQAFGATLLLVLEILVAAGRLPGQKGHQRISRRRTVLRRCGPAGAVPR